MRYFLASDVGFSEGIMHRRKRQGGHREGPLAPEAELGPSSP